MGISVWQLLIILAIVLVLFGAKRLGSLGSDLGKAVKGFRSAVSDKDQDGAEEEPKITGQSSGGNVYENKQVDKEKDRT